MSSKFKSVLAVARGEEEDLAKSPQSGRSRGKRSHPDFQQITAYIRKETHQKVKIALLQEGEGREFSELVEELLGNWLESRS
ncbi:hypothetical protein MYX82_02690 [Acidobacteria bacterium AH-259-D05]|nr:hypothetical protein [Acidobacteria bacterium AH-259-D05]